VFRTVLAPAVRLWPETGTPSWRYRFQVRPRRDLARDTFLFLGLFLGIVQGLGFLRVIDSRIYWSASLDALYPAAAWASGDPAYVYLPPLAQLLAPLHFLPFEVFQAAWTLLLFGCLWYCAGRWSWLLLALGVAGSIFGLPDEVTATFAYSLNGNVQLILAAAIVASLRNPALWTMPLLTKPTMGVGLLWYAFRREWRSLVVALAATILVVLVSFLLAPHLWFDFAQFALRNGAMNSELPLVPVPLPIRMAMSVGLLLWAAPRDYRWAVPLAAGWAIPLLYAGTYVAIWIGAIRLVRPAVDALGMPTQRPMATRVGA
jgi:hypothetical protein